MIIFLPKENIGMDGLINKLDYDYYQKSTSKFLKHKVNVLFPKFNFQAAFNLKNTLQNMGMSNAFSPEDADFSAMGDRLYIDDVIHKSYIDVNEKGTEAAAATAVVMVETSFYPEEITFNANKPFVFLIKDNAAKSIVFIGSLQNPQQK